MKKINFRSPVAVATMVSILVLILSTLVLQRNIHREAESWQWVVHTREVLENLQHTLALVNEAEAAQRGFLLTGNEYYLSVYQQTKSALDTRVNVLQQLTIDNPVQKESLPVYENLLRQRVSRMDDVLESKLKNESVDLSNLESGRLLKVEILNLAAKIRAEEQSLLVKRQNDVERARSELITAVAAVVMVSIILMILMWLISERDAAHIRQAQNELAEINQHLEQRIQERTQQINEANEELRAFAHTVAHDLRAPLRNVEGFASALLEDESERMSEDGKLFAGRICAAVVRMDRLITDLLAYSRLSRAELRLEQVQLNRVVQTVMRDLEAEITQAKARIIVAEHLPAVRANEGVLTQIISNLVTNAIKFVDKGTQPQVRIHGNTENGIARFVVEDNGIGINPEHRERIFGVFERLHGQERYPGTGIGLAIVKKGTERMGGEIGISSQPSGGTAFEIKLPAAA